METDTSKGRTRGIKHKFFPRDRSETGGGGPSKKKRRRQKFHCPGNAHKPKQTNQGRGEEGEREKKETVVSKGRENESQRETRGGNLHPKKGVGQTGEGKGTSGDKETGKFTNEGRRRSHRKST